MFNLKVKTTSGTPLLLKGKVNGESTFTDLKRSLYELTSIPVCNQKILSGFPPRLLSGSSTDKLQSLGIKNGEVIIVQDVPSNTSLLIEKNKKDGVNINHSKKMSTASSDEIYDASFPKGDLLKFIVPSDNSCLFASIYYLLNGGQIVINELTNLRHIVAEAISQNKSNYNEVVLEKSNEEYCEWIIQETSWGGAIELSILSEYYEIEMVAIDAKCGIINRFGEDKQYDNRIFLMYDGIHYDPLQLVTYDNRILYVFPITEYWLLEQAYQIAQDAKKSGMFTDTHKFKLKCNQCSFHMQGEDEAVKHAMETSHTAFVEVQKPQ